MQHVVAAGDGPIAGVGDGLTIDDLMQIEAECIARGMAVQKVFLEKALEGVPALREAAPHACVLMVKDFAKGLCHAPASDLFTEMTSASTVRWDTKALMRGQVKNKLARHNVCFSDTAQEADIAAGKGTVVPFDDVPLLHQARATLGELHPKLLKLPAEGNDYFDFRRCGIGFHGDAERPLTVGIRLYGSDQVKIPLHFQWYQRSKPVGRRIVLDLPHGSGYFMCEKATGFDWRKTAGGLLTLRHAAAGEGQKATNRFLRPNEISGEVLRFTL